MRLVVAATTLATLTLVGSTALAATLQVGPTRTYKTLAAVAAVVNPGDVVEVDGGATYAASVFARPGTATAKITLRGVPVGGKRPLLSGGTNTIELQGDHYVVEGFEITGGSFRCVYHHAHDITLRDVVIHDCPKHGLLGADNDSGSLTLEYSEVYKCGGGTQDHQIYMATDESTHPGSVFRMQFNYIHDGNGGNGVKSRAERNEIYYNWIEGSLYHELELIGPDPSGGVAAGLKREDSDVVGNVLRKTQDFAFVRVGGDGTGETKGRYRFVHNTFVGVSAASTVFRIFDGIESIEMHDNVFFRPGGGLRITRTVEAAWVAGEQMAGSNNWVVAGSTDLPAKWTGTLTGADPGFVAVATYDYTPAAGGAIVDKGAAPTGGPPGYAFPTPLGSPLFHPPRRAKLAPGAPESRTSVGPIDLGAFERGGGAPSDGGVPDTGTPADTGTPTDTGTPADAAPGSDTGAPGDAGPSGDAAPVDDSGVGADGGVGDAPAADEGGCGCRTSRHGGAGAAALLLGLAAWTGRRRQARRTR